MALLHELGNDDLLLRRTLAIQEVAYAYESLQQGARHHGVANAQTRE